MTKGESEWHYEDRCNRTLARTIQKAIEAHSCRQGSPIVAAHHPHDFVGGRPWAEESTPFGDAFHRPPRLRLLDDDLAEFVQPELDLFARSDLEALPHPLRKDDLTLPSYGVAHR